MKKFSENICAPFTDKYFGMVECEITNLKTKIDKGWSVFSMLTLYTINLFGFPIACQLSAVKINVKIYDCDHSFTKEYSANGIGKAYSAMYWGYPYFSERRGTNVFVDDKSPVSRAAHARAVANALQKIKKQMSKDVQLLIKSLKRPCQN